MDLKRWTVAWIGAYASLALCDFFVHGVWLGPMYQLTASLWRPAAQMQSLLWLMWVSQAVLAALLTLIYVKGYDPKYPGARQGFRYGVLMGFLLGVPCNLMHLVVYSHPVSLVLNWLVATVMEIIIVGVVIGLLYKPKNKVATRRT